LRAPETLQSPFTVVLNDGAQQGGYRAGGCAVSDR
jgi:hypothetical protein